MSVVGWSRSVTQERADDLGIAFAASPLDVARQADIVSLHVASNAETRHLVNATFLSTLRDGSIVINTTRGAVIDEDALLAVIDEKALFVGLDVFENEPSYKEGDLSNALASHPRVYLTHHIGASTAQASSAIGDEAVRIVSTYAETGVVANCVNLAEQTGATYMLTVRHLDKVGVLASVLDEMRKSEWNVQEMENLVFAGEEAACARIRFAGTMNQETIARIASNDDVIAVSSISLTD